MKLSEIQGPGWRISASGIRRRYPHKFLETWHEKPKFKTYSYSDNFTLNPYHIARRLAMRFSMKRKLNA